MEETIPCKPSKQWLLAWGIIKCIIDQTDPENVLDYEQKVNAITVEDLQKAAKKFLTLNNMVKAVLYPESSNIPQGVKTVKPF